MKRILIIAIVGFLGIAACNDDLDEITVTSTTVQPTAGDGDGEEKDPPPPPPPPGT